MLKKDFFVSFNVIFIEYFLNFGRLGFFRRGVVLSLICDYGQYQFALKATKNHFDELQIKISQIDSGWRNWYIQHEKKKADCGLIIFYKFRETIESMF